MLLGRRRVKATLLENSTKEVNSELFDALKTHFPQFFDKNDTFKTDKFLDELKSGNIAESCDGYRLNFVGKDYARLQTGRVSETVIVPNQKHNDKSENKNSGNIFITGDNLETLRHLQNAYANKIKMIYIDPPYNTGQEFTYSDKFEFNDEKLKSALGYSDEEIARLKSIQGKSSHSAWLTFMYPRLKIAQKLLRDDGVIFVSIDDNEQANLKLLMDDVFGEGNFIADMIRQEKVGAGHDSKELAIEYDYILVYSKNKSKLKINKENVDVENDAKYNLQDNFVNERGKYYLRDLDYKGSYSSSLDYPIVSSNGKTIYAGGKTGRPNTWRWSEAKFKWGIENNYIVFKGEKVYIKQYQFVDNEGNSRDRFIPYRAINRFLNSEGTIELKELGLEAIFIFPKSVNLLKYLLRIASDRDSIILDFFAGSGTTAHAAMQLNAEDGGNRKFIMVQLDEPTNPTSEAKKAGYNTIDEISRERIKRAAQKIKTKKRLSTQEFDFGFKHFRLINPDVKTIDKIIEFDPNNTSLFDDDMIIPFAYPATDTSGLDTLLSTWLIGDGFTFDTHIEAVNFANYQAHYIKDTAMLYLINHGWDTEALKALLNQIGKNELCVNTIVVYPYSFSFEAMRELKTNIKTNLDSSPTIIERY
ncbi:MAG: site-specific DNA-methyltransferase [Campylobacteraceae bacterium]|jgi:adenine-specific DNA-methyltransferase|nr:site-specific DNA-methyltransferase [Campylobacteraceae bacterium]